MANDFEKNVALLNKIRDIKPAQIVQYAVVPIPDMLLILFIAYKLAGIGPVARWSWWWVISPFLIGILIPMLKILVYKVKSFIREVRARMKSDEIL